MRIVQTLAALLGVGTLSIAGLFLTTTLLDLLPMRALSGFGNMAPVALALGLLLWLRGSQGLRRVAVAAGALLLASTLAGHPPLGPIPMQDDSGSLVPCMRIVALEAPNIVVTDDGARQALELYRFTDEALALTPRELAARLDAETPDLRLGRFSWSDRLYFESPFPWRGPAWVWTPGRFAVHRLPRHNIHELGSALWRGGLATLSNGRPFPQSRLPG